MSERCKRGHLISEVGRTKSRHCKACKGAATREYGRRRYRHDPEYRRRQAENRRRWLARPGNRERVRETDRKWRARHLKDVRERGRFYAEAKRREAGVPPRNLSRETKQEWVERVRLPAEPFAKWLRENAPTIDKDRARWACANGMDESHVRRLQGGAQRRVHIDTVDRVVGPDVLNELYPATLDEPVAA